MLNNDQADPIDIATALVAGDGPAGIQRGDRVYLNDLDRRSGLQAWDTPRGIIVARTRPADAYEALGRVLSLSRKVD